MRLRLLTLILITVAACSNGPAKVAASGAATSSTSSATPIYTATTARHEVSPHTGAFLDVTAAKPAHSVDEAAAAFRSAGISYDQAQPNVEYGMLTSPTVKVARAAYAFVYTGIPCTSAGPGNGPTVCDVVDLIGTDDLALLGSYQVGSPVQR